MIETLNQKFVPITPPAAIVDNAAYTTAAIDTKGYDWMTIVVFLGATDIALAALSLGMSDTDGSYAAVANFATLPATLPSATDDNKAFAFHVDLTGKKRFFDLTVTAGDGTAGTFLAAFALLGRGSELPNSAAERGFSQEIFV